MEAFQLKRKSPKRQKQSFTDVTMGKQNSLALPSLQFPQSFIRFSDRAKFFQQLVVG